MFDEFELPRTQLPALPGEPVVLGLAESWGELPKATLEGLQAQLEQLGAGLILLSSRELVCLRRDAPRGGVVRASRVRQLWPSSIGPWHRAPAANAAQPGAGCANTRRSQAALAVVDEHGIVRWLQRAAQGEAALELLPAALGQARQHLQRLQRLASGARALAFSPAQLTAGLIDAMAATFGTGEGRGASPDGFGGPPPALRGFR
jgi:hypothetical protein